MSDPLSRATEALKAQHEEASPAPTTTRDAILQRAELGRRERRVSRAILWPIAAAFVLLGTWAAASGTLARVFSSSDAPASPPQVPVVAPLPVPSVSAFVVREPAPEPPKEEVPPPPVQSPAPPPTPSLTPAATDALYQAAHRAHFEDKDPASALTKWDAYLAASPQGRFAPEARYNRALCLVRLGRNQEAITALRPFADGSYRASEAKALIEALTDASTP